ncbi:MAG: DMT family transporter [Sulfuricellaceae bacterium]|nr:DMT family transporter [Sulfuricellaceae bacterium]
MPARLIGHLGALVAVLCWGLSFGVGRELALAGAPWTLSAWRYTLAWLAAAALARLVHGKTAPPATQARTLAAMGLLGHAGFGVCFFLGVEKTAPVVAAAISGLEPLLIYLIGAAAFGHRPGAPRWLGMGLATAGAAWVNWAGASPAANGAGLPDGPLWILASAACFALYTHLGAKLATPPLVSLAATLRAALPILWLGACAEHLSGAAALAVPDLPGLAFFVLGVTVAAFLGWNEAVSRLGPLAAANWASLIPLVAVAGEAWSGKPVPAPILMGTVLLAAGLSLAARPRRKLAQS